VVKFDREYDAEVKLLENFTQKYGSTPNIKGTLRLTSERPFCTSCSDVIEQFKQKFPNIQLDLTNGTETTLKQTLTKPPPHP
jgi:hypothetical protein